MLLLTRRKTLLGGNECDKTGQGHRLTTECRALQGAVGGGADTGSDRQAVRRL
jgi:hypothetical protein